MRQVPFAVPDITELERDALDGVVRSGWLTTGSVAAQFEQDFSAHMGDASIRSLAVSSATAGLHLALDALGVGPGDEVLVPTWTFTATAEVVRYMGALPVLVDVEPESLTIDWDDARKKVTARTKVVMPVHFAGAVIPLTQLQEFRDETGVHVVEDAAHCIPSEQLGEHLTSGVSDALVFSFYATKPISTGEGGMVCVRQDIARRISVMRLHGIDRDVFDRYRDSKSTWRYDVVAPGFKYNMPDTAAAIGQVQLKRAREMRDRRTAVVDHYREGLTNSSLVVPGAEFGGGDHAAHLCVVRTDGIDRDDFIASMRARGVACSVHFTPLHTLSYWRTSLSCSDEDFPAATKAFQSVVSLPLYSAMSADQVNWVIEVALEFTA